MPFSFEIPNLNNPLLISAMSKLSYAIGGFLVGRKVYQISAFGSNKIGGIIARIRGIPTDDWNKNSKENYARAKKGLIRDLTSAAGFIAMGASLGKTESLFREAETKLEWANQLLDKINIQSINMMTFSSAFLIFSAYRFSNDAYEKILKKSV